RARHLLWTGRASTGFVASAPGPRRGSLAFPTRRSSDLEDDHLLEGAGPEGRKGFHDADAYRAGSGNRITDQAAEDCCDEAFQTDQETGVVVDCCDGGDEHAGQCTDGGCHGERQRSEEHTSALQS